MKVCTKLSKKHNLVFCRLKKNFGSFFDSLVNENLLRAVDTGDGTVLIFNQTYVVFFEWSLSEKKIISKVDDFCNNCVLYIKR